MRPADKALNLADDMISTGLNHIAFDVGPAIEAGGLDGLRGFLSELNREVWLDPCDLTAGINSLLLFPVVCSEKRGCSAAKRVNSLNTTLQFWEQNAWNSTVIVLGIGK